MLLLLSCYSCGYLYIYIYLYIIPFMKHMRLISLRSERSQSVTMEFSLYIERHVISDKEIGMLLLLLLQQSELIINSHRNWVCSFLTHLLLFILLE